MMLMKMSHNDSWNDSCGCTQSGSFEPAKLRGGDPTKQGDSIQNAIFWRRSLIMAKEMATKGPAIAPGKPIEMWRGWHFIENKGP